MATREVFWSPTEVKKLVQSYRKQRTGGGKTTITNKKAGLGESVAAATLRSYRPVLQETLIAAGPKIEALLRLGLSQSDKVADGILLLPPLAPVKAFIMVLPGGTRIWRAFVHAVLSHNASKVTEVIPFLLRLYDMVLKGLESGRSFTQVASDAASSLLRMGGGKKHFGGHYTWLQNKQAGMTQDKHAAGFNHWINEQYNEMVVVNGGTGGNRGKKVKKSSLSVKDCYPPTWL